MVWHRFCLSVATRNSGYKSPEVAEECNRNYYSEDLWAICERLSAFLEECATNFEYRTRVACQARKRCIAHRQRAYPNTHEFVPKKKNQTIWMHPNISLMIYRLFCTPFFRLRRSLSSTTVTQLCESHPFLFKFVIHVIFLAKFAPFASEYYLLHALHKNIV